MTAWNQSLKIFNFAIWIFVEALLLGGGDTATSGGPPPKDEAGLKEWIRNKLKVSASLPGKLGVKATEALPGIFERSSTEFSIELQM